MRSDVANEHSNASRVQRTATQPDNMAVSINVENPADMSTWWCVYCLCEGVGMGPVGSPCCKNDQKCLCLKSQGIGDLGPVAGDEGLCVSNAKSMCLVQAFQIIPTKPFIEVRLVLKIPVLACCEHCSNERGARGHSMRLRAKRGARHQS